MKSLVDPTYAGIAALLAYVAGMAYGTALFKATGRFKDAPLWNSVILLSVILLAGAAAVICLGLRTVHG